MKSFNTSVVCVPEKHYMVDMTGRVNRIIDSLIQENKYFTISRARQFGKTTILSLLRRALKPEFYVLAISFAGRSSMFDTEASFVRGFVRKLRIAMKNEGMEAVLVDAFSAEIADEDAFGELDERITELCRNSDREIILTIDEVNQSTNNQITVDFLALLRDKYIRRETEGDHTFKSVILAGVYDIKNLQIKIRPREQHRYNSPWNVAADYNINMLFGTEEIAKMLSEYKADHGLDFDEDWFAGQIYSYTSGYPFMVSRICQLLDEVVTREKELGSVRNAWTLNGFFRAIKIFVEEDNTLFDDLEKKLNDYSDLRELMYRVIVSRESVPYSKGNGAIRLGDAFCWLKNEQGKVVVFNRIFETRIYNLFIDEKSANPLYQMASLEKNDLKNDAELNMDLIMERFMVHYQSIYGTRSADFLENEAVLIFLTFLKPVINGYGNYYIEAETADKTKTDIVVDYKSKQYIIEAKVWHGRKYQEAGISQLAGYLERYHQEKGWLLTFCFNKNKEKLVGSHDLESNGKRIREVIV
ncbi:MAG: AAA family ATPase [Lachnospiraceae bacterium]|nr:AAA family ATPase [Lachnospiraceae bacterium]